MRKQRWYLSVAALAGLGASCVAVPWTFAQADEGAEEATDAVVLDETVAAGNQPARSSRSAKNSKKRFPTVNDRVKDLQAVPGLLTLYQDKPGPQRDPELLMMKVPARMLDTDLLFATSISSGGSLTGFMWDDYLIRWQVAGRNLKLMTPDVRYVRDQSDPRSDVVARTYNPRYLAAVPIEAMDSNGDVLIDLNKLLKQEVVSLPGVGGVRSDLSTWGKIKNFPDNMLIEAHLASGGRSGGNIIGVTYAFRRLPNANAYKPRVADQRVGYFLTARQDWSKDPNARTTFERYINRWQLEKQDTNLELSPPKDPILIIIEKTVPIQWRRWVREGVEEWNKAFEKIGFDRAIVVQQQTDSNEYADYDPEDARYNFFRWITSGRAFAMGPSRADPRTGQILDADILFDDAFVRAYFREFDLFAPSNLAHAKGPAFRDWVDKHPELIPGFLQSAMEEEVLTPQQELWHEIEHHLQERGRCLCGYARGMQQQIAFGYHALVATGASGDKKLPEKYIGEAIKQVVTHEVGHILGLRHNFKASAWLTLDEIKRRRNETDLPTTASTMDYNPILFFEDDELEKVNHFITPTIGPYDEWAIEYGYAIPKGESEEKMLQRIASRGNERALRYATDEDTMWVYTPDPETARFDMSSQPGEWAMSRVLIADKLLADIRDWALEEGEPYYLLRQAFNTIWWERANQFEHVARLVSGQYFNRSYKGDPEARPPFVIVDPDVKREALKTLGETVFNDEFFAMDAELLNYLPPERWYHWGSAMQLRLDYPVHDRIKMLQAYAMLDLVNTVVHERIYDAELKSDDPNKFTVAEYIRTLRDIIFRDLEGAADGEYSDTQPMISSITRNLQRDYLDTMLMFVQQRPDYVLPADIQAMMRLALRELSDRIAGVMSNPALDFASRAHLLECKSRIDRVLNAQFEAR